MSFNEKAYNQAYYLIHRKHIRMQRRLWYIKNREMVRAKQAEYNRQNATRIKATRASQKPVRQSVHHLSETDQSGSRDNPAIGGTTELGHREHGDALPAVSSARTSAGRKKSGHLSAPSANVVSKHIDRAEAKAVAELEALLRKESIPDAEQQSSTSKRSTRRKVR